MRRRLAWIPVVLLAATLGALALPNSSLASSSDASAQAHQPISKVTCVNRKEKLLTLARQWDLAIPPTFNPLGPGFGASASGLLAEVQAYIGIPATGVWGTATQYAVYPPSVAEAALIYYHDEQSKHDMDYSETRPMVFAHLPGVPPVCDCSWFATQCYWDAERPDPNGDNYDGWGDTQTLLAHGARVTQKAALPGDLVFYGIWGDTANPAHVAVFIGNGQVVSMGQQGDPATRSIGYRKVVAVRRYP